MYALTEAGMKSTEFTVGKDGQAYTCDTLPSLSEDRARTSRRIIDLMNENLQKCRLGGFEPAHKELELAINKMENFTREYFECEQQTESYDYSNEGSYDYNYVRKRRNVEERKESFFEYYFGLQDMVIGQLLDELETIDQIEEIEEILFRYFKNNVTKKQPLFGLSSLLGLVGSALDRDLNLSPIYLGVYLSKILIHIPQELMGRLN